MQANVIFGQKAKNKLLEGAMKATDAVKVTLGARGRNVIIESPTPAGAAPLLPRITKDGVTIANSLADLGDNTVTQGARIVIGVAQKTVQDAGDGTTTSMILATEMFSEGLKVMNKDVNPVEFMEGMRVASAKVQHFIKTKCAKEVEGDRLFDVASISANGDVGIGRVVADTIAQVGPHGMVHTKPSGAMETYAEIASGALLESGMMNLSFATDFQKEEAIYERPLVFISDMDINELREEALPVFRFAAERKRPLVFICDEMSGEALHTALYNRANENMKIVVIRAPYMGDMRTKALEDLALYLGGTYFAEDKGISVHELTKVTPNGGFIYPLGECAEVRVTRNQTRFIQGYGDEVEIKKRTDHIIEAIEEAPTSAIKESLRQRLSRFQGKVAVINVAGSSDVDIHRQVDLIDDAVHATQAAMSMGVVPGGGITLLVASHKFSSATGTKSFQLGHKVVMDSIIKPIDQILDNAGLTSKQRKRVITELLLRNQHVENHDYYIYDASQMRVTNALKHGIIDPAKVVAVCVENAVSAAQNLLSTEAFVYSQGHLDKYNRRNENNR
jgi:chaperonin GroEL